MILAGCFVGTKGFAQLPPPEQLKADLAGLFATTAAKPIIRNPDSPWDKRVAAAMQQQARYLVSTLKPWKGDPSALTMTPGKSKEHDIRPNAGTVYGLASLYRTVSDGYPADLSRDACRDKAIALLRFILPTHGAGGVKCDDGQQWHNQWQSALWTYHAGRGCWLLWDELTPEMQWMAARMICDEADRFIDQPPPSQVNNDTKAEENAWNSTVISLAYCMFPHHPHSGKWRETSIRWAITSFATKQDLTSTTLYDGKPLKDWLTGANIHDDYTLENHNRVHPDYMNTVNLLLFQRELYEWAAKPPPQALRFNMAEVYLTLKKLSLPDGGYIYPNGQDWQLRRNPQWHEVHAVHAVEFRDPEASLLFARCFEALEKMQARDPNGGVFLPTEYNFPSTQPDTLMMLAQTHHLLGSLGEPVSPVTDEQFRDHYAGLHLFKAGKFGLLRTPDSIASFSWGRQVMGNVLPLDKDLLVAPNERNLVGRMRFEGVKSDAPQVESAQVMESTNTLAVIGRISRGGGAAKQQFAFVALPDGRSVYVDNVQLTSTPKVLQMDLGLLSILNDTQWVHSDGTRELYCEGDQKMFSAEGGDVEEFHTKSNWYNIDDKLGIGVLQSSGRQSYTANHKMNNGRLEQSFSLNECSTDAASTSSISPTVLVFYPSKDHAITRQLVSKCTAQPVSSNEPFAITLDDGKQVRISFSSQQLSVE